MSALNEWFSNNTEMGIAKYDHYLDIYERYFSKYRGKSPRVLEIGVCHGGSLQMWNDYFKEGCSIHGIDINPNCKKVEKNGVCVHIGDQTDVVFLEQVMKIIGIPDIIIDDGGHSMNQQKVSFDFLFPKLAEGGIYLCEDLHTSYWRNGYGGGYRRRGTFIEFLKGLIDNMHAFHSQNRFLKVDYMTEHINGIHFHDSIVIIEKSQRAKPKLISSGIKKVKDLEKILWYRHVRKWLNMRFKI